MMPDRALDWPWVEPRGRIDRSELARLCRLEPAELDELVDFGALVPLPFGGRRQRQFSAHWVAPLREAARLKAYYDLDLFTVGLLLGYLQRIAQLEHQVRSAHGHLPHPQTLPREGPTPWREPHW